MDRSVEEYQKDLLWQTALETFYRVAYVESLMSSSAPKMETDRWNIQILPLR